MKPYSTESTPKRIDAYKNQEGLDKFRESKRAMVKTN
jgi:hypothetical protein